MKKETNKKDTYERVVEERDGYRRTLKYMIRNFACQFTEEQHNEVQKLLQFEKEKIPRATKGQTYYCIDDNIKVSCYLELNDYVDERFYKLGNYFVTKNQAEYALIKIKQAIKEVHNESN